MKTIKEIEDELFMKENRVSYWERFGVVPSMNELFDYIYGKMMIENPKYEKASSTGFVVGDLYNCIIDQTGAIRCFRRKVTSVGNVSIVVV